MDSTLISIIKIIGSLILVTYCVYKLVKSYSERKAITREVAPQNSKDEPTQGEVILEKFIKVSNDRRAAENVQSSENIQL